MIRAPLWLVALLLSGCASLPQNNTLSSNDQVDNWLEQQRYDRALRLIDTLPDQDPEYATLQRRKPAIERSRQAYVDKAIEQAKQASHTKDWTLALEILKDSQKNLPGNDQLNQAYLDTLKDRDDFIRDQQNQLLVAEAQYVLSRYPYQDEIMAAWPNNLILKTQRWRLNNKARTLSKKLLNAGRIAYENQEPEATELLTLSNLLHPREETQQILAILHEQQKQREAARLAAARNRYQANVNHWTEVFHDAMKQDDLQKAREAIGKLGALKPRPTVLVMLDQQLNSRINEKVEAGLSRGKLLYSQGDIQKALDVWLETQTLDPGNVLLKDYIGRARRFLANLEKLS